MLTVIETSMFQRYAAAVWTDAEREEFIDWIADNPEAGVVIPDAPPLRKLRWARAGMGKRGGVRVIFYYTALANGTVKLLIVYPKSATDNLSRAFVRELRKLVE